MLDLLEKHFVGEVNEIFESFQFFSRQQRESETTTAYIAEIRRLAATCNFGDLTDRMIRDKIVCGIRDNGLRKSLLEDTKLTLKKCVERCKAVESSGQQAQNIVKTRQDTCQDQPLSLNHVRTRAAQRPPLQSVRGQLREQRLPAGAGPHGGSYVSRCRRCSRVT